MGVDDQVLGLVIMASHMHGDYAFWFQAGEENRWIEAVVHRVDVHIVNVEQQVAIRLAEYCVGERQFVHVLMSSGVVRDVLYSKTTTENVLCTADARSNVMNGLLSEWQ